MSRIIKRERKNWFYSYNVIFEVQKINPDGTTEPLSEHAKIIYLYLCRCADSVNQAFPSHKDICDKCGIKSPTTVKKGIKELVDIGFVQKEFRFEGTKNGKNRQTSNEYYIYDSPDETKAVIKSHAAIEDKPGQNEKEQDSCEPPAEEKDIENSSEGPQAESKKIQGKHTKPPRSSGDPRHLVTTPRSPDDYPPSHQVTTKDYPYRRTTQDKDLSVCPNTDQLVKENKKTSEKEDRRTEISNKIKKEELLDLIKESCELHIFPEDTRRILDNALDIMFYTDKLKVQNSIIPGDKVRSKMTELNGSILDYAWQKAKASGKEVEIKNSTKYLMACIYSAIAEYHSDACLNLI